jgi:hypothetical protein
MTLDKRISDLLPTQVPDYVQEFYPLFVIFVTKYFEWLEQTGNPQEIIQNIQLDVDIDTTATSLATKFMAMYAPDLPQTSELDRSILVKHFRDFYVSKGSEESYRYFFRAFFNDEIAITLPGDRLFKSSNADWYVEKTLRVNAVTGNPRLMESAEIIGTSSNATAIVEEVVNSYGGWDIRLQNRSVVGEFHSSETITAIHYDHVENTSSQITVLNTKPLQILPGRQRGNDSLLSADQIIQDSFYWQKFSYVVRTRIDLNRWQDAVLEQLHPSGRNLFGEVIIDNSTSMTVSSVTQFSQSNVIESEVRLFTSSTSFYLVPGVTWDRLANGRTGTSATVTAESVVYDASYTYAGENVTFALQGITDAGEVLEETITYTSITGTVSVNVTTSVTTTSRDIVSYSMPVTSLTGTISASTADVSSTITLTGVSTLFTAEIEPTNVWRRVTGQDAGLNPIYEYNTAVLTIRELAVTGTATLAAQTPVAPDYLLYVSGIGTRFRSDLLVNTETTTPIVESGQPEPLLYLNNYILSGDITFTSGSTSVVGVNSQFSEISQLSTSTLTVIKPLRGLFTQVSSVPGLATAVYEITPDPTVASTTISGTTLSFSATTSNASAVSTAHQAFYGTASGWRIDIPTPFPVQILTTSTTKLYVHSSGFIASDTSAPSAYSSVSTFRAFRPFTGPYVGVDPNILNRLRSVHWGTQGTAPNRYFTIHYNGDYEVYQLYPGQSFTFDSSMVIRGTAGAAGGGTLGAAKTRTSGTTTNGYYEITMPWAVYFSGSSYTKIYVSNNSRVSFGNWITYDSSQTITTPGLLSGVLPHVDLCNNGYAGLYDTTFPVYYNVTSVSAVYYNTFGTAPNRTFVVRFEGDHQSGALVRVIWELQFEEANPFSFKVNFAHPAQTGANTYANLGNVSVYGVSYQEAFADEIVYPGLYGISYPYYGYTDADPSIASPVTSGMVRTSQPNQQLQVIELDLVNEYPRGEVKWEMSFPENSASSIILRTGRVRTRQPSAGIYYVGASLSTYDTYTPFTLPTPNFKAYGQSSGSNLNPDWEWGEAPVTSAPSTLVWQSAPTLTDSSTYAAYFVKIPTIAALSAPIPQTSGLVLLRAHTQGLTSSTVATASSVSTFLELGVNSSNYPAGGFVPGSRACDTSTGLLARFPQDGYNATANNTNPNPCIPITSNGVSYCYSQTYVSKGGYYNFNTTSTAGLLFAYGSSASTHSRFVQSVPTFGRTHRTSIRFLVGTGASAGSTFSTLNKATSGQDLELWYQTGDDPQPPTDGVSPSTLGWTRQQVLFTGGSSTGFSFGGIVGTKTATVTTASDTSLSWLIWQKSFTGTGTTSNTSLSNYLLTYWAVSSTMAATGTTSTSLTALYFAGNRLQVGSGSVVRIPNRTTKAGATVLEDFYVAENPRLRSVNGDAYLVLRPVATVTSVPYVASINNWFTSAVTSYGIYSAALTNIPVYLVETRTINNIANETTLTVTAAWSSTSNRSWATQASGFSTRVFAINSVASDTGLSLRALAQASSRYLPPVVSLTTASTLLADRRFSVVSIANDTTITVSGGGVYTNITNKTATFARRETGIEGYTITGFHNGSNLTANTTWVSSGLPGTDYLGNNYGTDLSRLTVTIGNSSFTVVRVVNDTTILVTGSAITSNFWDTSMVSRFPAPSSQIIITGTGTKFLASSVTTTGATAVTTSTEEVTEYDNDDRRTGYLSINGQVFSIVDISSDTVLVASSNAVTAAISGATGESFRRVRVGATGRQLVNPGGASFDKFGANITNDDTLVVQDPNVDFALVRELYHNTSVLALGSSTLILNTSISLSTGSSVILLVTWIKDLNIDVSTETYNALNITASSTGTFIANFNDEVQRNHRDIAVGRSLMYSKSVYLTSSNSIISTNVVAHGDTTGTAVWNWTPSNMGRPGTYSRFSAVLSSSSATSMTVYVKVAGDVSSTWNTGSLDFLNITVIGAT